ncbi:MAG: hypothetical protein NW226_16435 [Microscillaceae bacterium]|nr:hypothetical protein [Microscillaceae bacterium]
MENTKLRILTICFIIALLQTSCYTTKTTEFYLKLDKAAHRGIIFTLVIEYNNPTDKIFVLPKENMCLVHNNDTLWFEGNYDFTPVIIYRTTDKVKEIIQEIFYKRDIQYLKMFAKKAKMLVINKNTSYNLDSLKRLHYLKEFKFQEFVLLPNMEILKSQNFELVPGNDLYKGINIEKFRKRIITSESSIYQP